jgi:hypothetical protein
MYPNLDWSPGLMAGARLCAPPTQEANMPSISSKQHALQHMKCSEIFWTISGLFNPVCILCAKITDGFQIIYYRVHLICPDLQTKTKWLEP